MGSWRYNPYKWELFHPTYNWFLRAHLEGTTHQSFASDLGSRCGPWGILGFEGPQRWQIYPRCWIGFVDMLGIFEPKKRPESR